MIPSMIIEPAVAATIAEQNICQSLSAVAARPPGFLFACAKRQPAIPIRKLRLAPSNGGFTLSTRSARRLWPTGNTLDQMPQARGFHAPLRRFVRAKSRFEAGGSSREILWSEAPARKILFMPSRPLWIR
jgi:hypothetical protein